MLVVLLVLASVVVVSSIYLLSFVDITLATVFAMLVVLAVVSFVDVALLVIEWHSGFELKIITGCELSVVRLWIQNHFNVTI